MYERETCTFEAMAEHSIFVYQAHDREGQILAALVSHCDAEQAFRFLPVEGARSTDRMHRFLRNHLLHPETVNLPFVILVGPGGPGAAERSVLRGSGMRTWLNGVVDALALQGVPPANLRDSVVLPHVSEPTARLLAYAFPAPPPAEAPAPPSGGGNPPLR